MISAWIRICSDESKMAAVDAGASPGATLPALHPPVTQVE
jgi:hypothetical protein